jgi:hypothetical protein
MQKFCFKLTVDNNENRGYWMSVGLILNLLNELDKIIWEPLGSIILFYLTSSINLVLNLHKYEILFITYLK